MNPNFFLPEGAMLAWETSTTAVKMRRRFDEDADEFEDDGFSFDDTEDDEDLDDEDLDDEEKDEDDIDDEEFDVEDDEDGPPRRKRADWDE
jgi:hypothetical protein